jgi:hypothetical protein
MGVKQYCDTMGRTRKVNGKGQRGPRIFIDEHLKSKTTRSQLDDLAWRGGGSSLAGASLFFQYGEML